MIPLPYEMLRASGARPRVHGNGFLQLDLNPEGTQRLHGWDDALPRQATRSSVHDHVFALRSTVICGVLEHIEYQPWPTIEGDWQIYRAEQVEGSTNTELRPSGEFVDLIETLRLQLRSGLSYTFPAWSLHDTDHRGLTATVMEKIDAPSGYGRPRVLVHRDEAPDNEFDREGFDQEFLWQFVYRALELQREGL